MAFGLGATVLASPVSETEEAGAVPAANEGGFWNGLGDAFGGVLDTGTNFLNGLLQIDLANRIAGSPAQQAAANTAAANAAATQSAQSSSSGSLIAGVPNGVFYGGAALVVVLLIVLLVKG